MEPETTQYRPTEGRQFLGEGRQFLGEGKQFFGEGRQFTGEGKQFLGEGEHHVKGKFLPAQRVCYTKPTLEQSELPTAIKEKIIKTERIEIQPVLQRDREQLEIRQIQQPIREHLIHQTDVKEELLPTKDIGEFREERTEYTRPLEKSAVEMLPLERETFRKPPIVEERIHKKIVEEIQPVIYREIEQPHLIRVTQPVVEKVVEAPVVLREVLPTKDLGSHYVETKLAPAMEGVRVSQGQNWPSETYQYMPGEGLQYKEGGAYTGGSQYSEGWQYKPGETQGAQYRESGKAPFQESWQGKSVPYQEGWKSDLPLREGGTQYREGGTQFKEGGTQFTGGTGGTVIGEETRKLSSFEGTTVPSEKMQV